MVVNVIINIKNPQTNITFLIILKIIKNDMEHWILTVIMFCKSESFILLVFYQFSHFTCFNGSHITINYFKV